MVEIVWDKKFRQLFKKWSKKHPDLVEVFKNKLELFVKDPFHPQLKTHSLSGILKGLWAFHITYEYRLVFKFLDKKKKVVLLIDVGSHDGVY
jgi:addiction module RelE/StbE family toxin